MKRSLILVMLLVLATACDPDTAGSGPTGVDAALPDSGASEPADAGSPVDAGLPPDAGQEEADAGLEADASAELDASLPQDAGEEDAGLADAGEPDAGTVDAGPQPFSFAVIADLHIGHNLDPYAGEEHNETRYARSAVARINRLAETENLAFVFVDGDLTDSAEEAEFLKAREILDGIRVPWFPTIGNHDQRRHAGIDDRDPTAVADATFVRIFGDKFRDVTVGDLDFYDFAVWNPDVDHESHFVNFELRYHDYVFIGLDWNSRKSAMYPSAGTAPDADLHDFPGGTLWWLERHLAQLPASTKRVFFIQHHGIKSTVLQPAFYFTFDDAEAAIYEQTLLDAQPAELYWGMFAGHNHRRWQGSAFDDWPEFQQMETGGCTVTDGEVTVVRVALDGTVTVGMAP